MKIDRYNWEGPAEHLLALIERANHEDDVAEKLHSRWNGLGCTGVVLLIGSVILAVNLGPVFFVLPVMMLGLTIFAFVRARGHGQHDLDDRKLASARRAISILRADVPSTWPLGLEVDFRTYDQGGTVVEKTGGRTGPRAAKYAHDWLVLRANLADGSSVVATLTDKVSRKEKPKRKRTKVAETFVTRASVTLRLGKHRGSAEAVAAHLRGTSPPGGCTVLSLEGSARVLSAVVAAPIARRVVNRSTTESGMDRLASGDTLLQTLSWLYGGVAARVHAA
ncbi:MAG TPA: hypothetical protein VI589_05030 [Vicinamibacteria bacterium]